MLSALAGGLEKRDRVPAEKVSGNSISEQERSAIIKKFEAYIASPDFPCVGAKAAMQRAAYRFGFYGELGADDAAKGCTADLQHFAATSDELDQEFATFVAFFAGPHEMSEKQFSAHLWRHLSLSARIDQTSYEWDTKYSSDPGDPAFAMSIGGRAFYVIGLHPGASRMARRFTQCALVFNAHSQFELLKSKGVYGNIKETIQDRDELLQGHINPMVEDHGIKSEALQYDGARHSENWQPSFSVEITGKYKCPFSGQ